MHALTGSTICRLMRQNGKTIRGIAVANNISMARVRHVRLHGVVGAAFAQDWLQMCTKVAA